MKKTYYYLNPHNKLGCIKYYIKCGGYESLINRPTQSVLEDEYDFGVKSKNQWNRASSTIWYRFTI